MRPAFYSVLFVTLKFFGFAASGQNCNYDYTGYEMIKIKEHFDDVCIAYFSDPNFPQWGEVSDCTNDVFDAIKIGSGRSGFMEGLLLVYNTTGDKAYLYQFTKEAIRVINKKGGAKLWGTGCFFPYNGRILYPLAHFIHLVKIEEPSLSSTEIYAPADYGNFNTFGAVADFLESKVNESLTEAINLRWDTSISNVGFKGGDGPAYDGYPAHMNFQAPWGTAFIYMYLVTGNMEHRNKAERLAALYFGNTIGGSPSASVLTIDGTTNSYSWYHDGWRPERTYIEDIGHGLHDIYFPIVYNRYRSQLNPTYFSDPQMERFRNVIKNKIWDPTNCTHRSAVNGIGPVYAESDPASFVAWIALDRFGTDSQAPYTYDLTLHVYKRHTGQQDLLFYTDHTYNWSATANIWASTNFEGLAYLTDLQWEKEQTSLTIRNRNLRYSQDFWAKKNLTIDNTDQNTNVMVPTNFKSLDDSDYNARKFIVQPGMTCNLSASESISIKGEFQASIGSHFRAFLNNPSSPTGRKKSSQIITSIDITIDEHLREQDFTIYPNPATRTIAISSTNSSSSNLEIQIIDGLGIQKREYQLPVPGTIDISSFSTGIYFIKIKSDDGKIFVKRFLKM